MLDNGLLSFATFHPSPNFNARPAPDDVSLLIIHNISLPEGQFGGDYIDDLFLNRLDVNAHPDFQRLDLANLKVSSHLVIRRDGDVIQYVPFHARAWHAGRSSFEGREDCNDYAIGIELEGTDTVPFTPIQYEKMTKIIRILQGCYPKITRDRIVGHCDVAPGRKTDPGEAFDWQHVDNAMS
ncbi:MAG: N-acetyl-anhydromuranmyl-L-alanine amidase [marine bacterium B5-7]|nr:MAG: N-acetyl-anhydromuranmyl-L-alanine amidase [marine bacterium B5-7]